MITAFTGETAFMFENYVRILRSEFRGYNADRLAKDFSAGMTPSRCRWRSPSAWAAAPTPPRGSLRRSSAG